MDVVSKNDKIFLNIKIFVFIFNIYRMETNYYLSKDVFCAYIYIKAMFLSPANIRDQIIFIFYENVSFK